MLDEVKSYGNLLALCSLGFLLTLNIRNKVLLKCDQSKKPLKLIMKEKERMFSIYL